MDGDVAIMRCPNCEKEFPHEDNVPVFGVESIEVLGRAGWETLNVLTLSKEPFPCLNCSAMIKTSDRFRRLNNIKHLPILPAFLFLIFLLAWVLITVSLIIGGHFSEPGLLFGLLFLAAFLIPLGICIPISVYASSRLGDVNRWEVAWIRSTCQRCGSIAALEDAEFCPACGASLPSATIKTAISEDQTGTQRLGGKTPKFQPFGTCLVCDLEMNQADVLAGCPHCGNIFHKAHLATWVRLNKRCPVCSERLAEREIKELSRSMLS